MPEMFLRVNIAAAGTLKNCFLPILNTRDSSLHTTPGLKIQPAAVLRPDMPDAPAPGAAAESIENYVAGMNGNQVKITILVDNKAASGLMAEHGLSFWIETEGVCILFDTGQGGALPLNARALGINLNQADMLVLSHGHFDHTGGIPSVMQQNSKTGVYAHPGIMHPRYSIRDGLPRPIQMPEKSMTILDRLPAQRIHWITQPLSLSENIGITGPIPRDASFEDTGGPFYLDPEGKSADPIEDDLALWIRTRSGLVVCAGCCHAGLVNTLNHVRRLTGEKSIRAVIGGFHLLNATGKRIELTVNALHALSPRMMVPCHCTGDTATRILQDALGERVVPGYAGAIYHL